MRPTDITEVAHQLEISKENRSSMALLLGARAGSLFRSQLFYETLHAFSTRNFRMLSRTQQFGECYKILTSSKFSEWDIHTILQLSLRSLVTTEADVCLADLVAQGLFNTIISTNIDDLLEEVLAAAGMREGRNYEVFRANRRPKLLDFHPPQTTLVIKAFGDLLSRDYVIKRSGFLASQKGLHDYLERVLAQDVLIVGLDPVWDADIIPAFPKQGGTLWYINESEPASDDILSQALQDRQTTYISGKSGSFENFWKVLYWHLFSRRPAIIDQDIASQLQTVRNEIEKIWQQEDNQLEFNPLMEDASAIEEQETPSVLDQSEEAYVLTPTPTELENEKKKRVFICYSHKDIKYLLRLQTHFASYGRKKVIDIWDDTKISAGAQWREEIARALETTIVAVLLISADFLASEFIAENELPPLLKAAESGGTIILPVILSPCVFEDTPLQQFQAVNHPSKPLSKLTGSGRDEVWVTLVKFIMKIVNNRDSLKIDEQGKKGEQGGISRPLQEH